MCVEEGEGRRGREVKGLNGVTDGSNGRESMQSKRTFKFSWEQGELFYIRLE